MRKPWRRVTLGAWLLGLVAASTLVVAGAATADHWDGYQYGGQYNGPEPQHELIEGNPDLCGAPAGGAAFRVDGDDLEVGGEYPTDNPIVRITALGLNGDGEIESLSWSLIATHDYDMAAVVVKASNDAIIYRYDSAGGGLDDSDSNLTGPINPQTERPYGISHVDFCLDPKGVGGPERLVVTKTADTSWEKVYNWDVEKSVDKSQLELKQGQSGTVQWKVDVTQTGSTARNAVVSGTITVQNPNDAAVTGVSVTDALPGAVVDCDGVAGAPLVSTGLEVPANGSLTCTYSAARESNAGGTNEASATGSLDGIDVSDTGSADFTFGDPSVEINETVKAVDGKQTWNGIDGTTSFTYDEQFPCSSNGRTNDVDLLGDNPATPAVETDFELDTDSAAVTVHCSSTPPPQNPPAPTGNTDEFMDVQVIKDATPQVQLVNGQADIAYTIRVKNNGPNQAHDVKLADSAPNGVTFLSVTQQPVNGTCSVSGGSLLQCSLGTLGPGVERAIGLSARVTQTGTYVNCATATGSGKDTNGANNMECASTLVTAPVTPPVATPSAKPKPKPKPTVKPASDICRVLKVTPGLVKANGRQQLVLAKVTRSKTPVKGVAVRFSGNGLAKVVKTNANGVAKLGIATSKAGIVLVRITSVKACNTARIGVVGVFEPPVTG